MVFYDNKNLGTCLSAKLSEQTITYKTRTRNVHKERSMTKEPLLMKISLVMKDKKVYERQEQQRKHMTHDM